MGLRCNREVRCSSRDDRSGERPLWFEHPRQPGVATLRNNVLRHGSGCVAGRDGRTISGSVDATAGDILWRHSGMPLLAGTCSATPGSVLQVIPYLLSMAAAQSGPEQSIGRLDCCQDLDPAGTWNVTPFLTCCVWCGDFRRGSAVNDCAGVVVNYSGILTADDDSYGVGTSPAPIVFTVCGMTRWAGHQRGRQRHHGGARGLGHGLLIRGSAFQQPAGV